METPWWALLLKGFIGIAWIAFLLGSARLGAWLIYKAMPDCRLKRVLFEGWHGNRAARRAKSDKRLLD